jgi:hypothetical protein
MFSTKMQTPGAAPYIEQPVSTNGSITIDKIKTVRDRPQQVRTIDSE